MRFTRNRSMIRCAMLTIAACGSMALRSQADVIRTPLNYETQGRVYSDDSQATIDPHIRFEGMLDAKFDSPGTFTLGKFVVEPLPDGASVGYLYAPFRISAFFTREGTEEFQGVTVLGHLNGVLQGGSESLLRATIDSVQTTITTAGGPYPLPDYGSFFPPSSLKVISPLEFRVGVNGGEFTVVGTVQAVPEPTSLIVLGLAFSGYGVLRGKVKRSHKKLPHLNGEFIHLR